MIVEIKYGYISNVKDRILEIIKDQKKIRLPKVEKDFLVEQTSFLSDDVGLRERIWCYINDIGEVQICPICKIKKLSWCRITNQYKKKCLKCNLSSEETRRKIKDTNIKRYGKENAFQFSAEKIKQTKLDRYGDSNYNNRDKFKKTLLAHGGIGWQSDIIQSKIKKTKLDRYGDSNYNNRDKMRLTNIKLYGENSYTKTFEYWKSTVINNNLSELELYEIFNLINDDDWLTAAYRNNTVLGLAKSLNISYKPLINRLIKLNEYIPKDHKSLIEKIIYDELLRLSDNIIKNSRSIISPLELDFYMPDDNLAIEINGLYWHSELYGINKNYHLNKTRLCKEKGIQLLHIFENEIYDEKIFKIWKSIIRNKLGKSSKIFARKCEIKEVSSKETRNFLDMNHLQGNCPSSINLGLFYNDELVSLMTFGKSRYNKKIDWELLRFCNKLNYSVVGGASRLFKYFLKKYDGSVISYADMRRSDGGLYRNLGFELSHKSGPNYWYFKNNNIELESRIMYQKHKLKNKLKIFDKNLTEWENMQLNGYNRIFDCGNQVWIYV